MMNNDDDTIKMDKRSDFLLKKKDIIDKNKDKEDKKQRIKVKNQGKNSTTKEDTTKEKEDDKLDTVIQILQDKDDKIAEAVKEMTSMLKMMIETNANINQKNEDQKAETRETTKEQFDEPLSTQALEFFDNEEKRMNEQYVKHVLSAQKDILTMSNNFEAQLDKINKMDRADRNIPNDDMDHIEESRRYDAKIIRDIAENVTQMNKEIHKLRYKIEKLSAENKEIKNECKENHQKLHDQLPRRNAPYDQPPPTSEREKQTEDPNPFTIVKNRKTRQKIPPVNITPKDTTHNTDTTTPPISYADVIFRHQTKPPKEEISREQIEAVPELKKDIEDDIENDREPKKFTKDEIEIIRHEIEKSSNIVGIKPISMEKIREEAQKLKKTSECKNWDHKKITQTATKNTIMRYFRDKLLMDDETRQNLEIVKIFPSQNPDANIMYIQCQNTDEVAKITACAKNIVQSNLKEDSAAIAIHIPKILYSRYIGIEKLMYQLRQSSKGNIQTNIRLGKTDFIARQKLKQDKRKWKDITPIEIPVHVSKPDLNILKNNKEETNNELYSLNEDETDNNKEIDDNKEQIEDKELDNYIIQRIESIIPEDGKKLTDTSGSVSEKLKSNNKHKRSPNQQQEATDNADKRKKIIPDEYQDAIEIMVDEMDTSNAQPANRNNITRTPSMNKIMDKIPQNVKLTKISQIECGKQTVA